MQLQPEGEIVIDTCATVDDGCKLFPIVMEAVLGNDTGGQRVDYWGNYKVVGKRANRRVGRLT